MKRCKDGYYDLDGYLMKKAKIKKMDIDKLEYKKIIKQCFDGTSALFWFKYYDINILFKPLDSEYSIFSELISEELAKYLGFRNAQYDIAIFNGRKGIITYDFKKPNYTYLSLYDIQKVYFSSQDFINYEMKLKSDEIPIEKYNTDDKTDYTNNLEDIWNILEWYLKLIMKDHPEKIPATLEKLMRQVTDYFLFQIISGNFDMHSGNIMFEISNDHSDVSMTPMYDNEDMFKESGRLGYIRPTTPRLSVGREDIHNEIKALDVLEEYLRKSDSSFVSRFKELYGLLNEDAMYNIVENVERKIGTRIPFMIHQTIINDFNDNLKNIQEIINKIDGIKR